MTIKATVDWNESRAIDVLVGVERASDSLAARWRILMKCTMQRERGDYHGD